MTIDTDRILSITVFRKDTHIDQCLNFKFSHTLHLKPWLVKTLFHRTDSLVTKANDMLSEQRHVGQILNQE